MGCFALLANDLTHITLGNFDFKYNSLATFNFINLNLFRVVDQCLYNFNKKIFHEFGFLFVRCQVKQTLTFSIVKLSSFI